MEMHVILGATKTKRLPVSTISFTAGGPAQHSTTCLKIKIDSSLKQQEQSQLRIHGSRH